MTLIRQTPGCRMIGKLIRLMRDLNERGYPLVAMTGQESADLIRIKIEASWQLYT